MNFVNRLFAASVAALTAVSASAHPGHDGHDLTWEFAGTHLHLDWLIGAFVMAAAAAAIYRLVGKRR
jgi:hypothetical protein